ncbi:hypothetical protein PFISCL1PPCAC_25102, partial [Pristionchus fissidentatus]
MFQGQSTLLLESLPPENLFQILSKLSLNDRNAVRQCSKSMKEAVGKSDLVVPYLHLVFDKNAVVRLEMPHLPRMAMQYNDLDAIHAFVLKQSKHWRRVCIGQFTISIDTMPISGDTLELLMNQ